MLRRSIIGGLGLSLALYVVPTFAQTKNSDVTRVNLKAVEQQVSGMGGILKQLLGAAKKAKEKNEVAKVNCLVVKINLVKGFMQAASRASMVLTEASFSDDQGTANAYASKITSYRKQVDEIGKSMDECSQTDAVREGTTLVYIRPEEGVETDQTEVAPWDWEEETGPEEFPAVPPASPFR